MSYSLNKKNNRLKNLTYLSQNQNSKNMIKNLISETQRIISNGNFSSKNTYNMNNIMINYNNYINNGASTQISNNNNSNNQNHNNNNLQNKNYQTNLNKDNNNNHNHININNFNSTHNSIRNILDNKIFSPESIYKSYTNLSNNSNLNYKSHMRNMTTNFSKNNKYDFSSSYINSNNNNKTEVKNYITNYTNNNNKNTNYTKKKY
jgi:hypothetical protein